VGKDMLQKLGSYSYTKANQQLEAFLDQCGLIKFLTYGSTEVVGHDPGALNSRPQLRYEYTPPSIPNTTKCKNRYATKSILENR